MRGRVQMDPFAFRDAMRQQDLGAAEAELRAFGSVGGSTVVDLGNGGFGRDPVGLAVLARLTGLNVVMGCGEYVEFGHSPYVRHVSAEVIRDVIVAELTDGAARTGVRAGVIGEIGTGNPPTPDELKVVRAAALAHRETGAPVNLHRAVFPDPLAGLVAVDAALNAGVDPGKLIVSHCDERPEPEFALEVARRGAFVELDTFGMEQWAVSAPSGDGYPARALDRDRVRLLGILLDARQAVIVSDAGVVPPGTPGVTEIDWGWAAAFYCAGYALRDLVPPGHAVTFLAGAAVRTQRALVDAFLAGSLDAPGSPPAVHVSYLRSFDDVETAEGVVRAALRQGGPGLFVSSSDGAGRAALELARAAGAPTISFLSGLHQATLPPWSATCRVSWRSWSAAPSATRSCPPASP